MIPHNFHLVYTQMNNSPFRLSLLLGQPAEAVLRWRHQGEAELGMQS